MKNILAFISNCTSRKTSGKMHCFAKGSRSSGGVPMCCTKMIGSYAGDLRKGMHNFCISHAIEVWQRAAVSQCIICLFSEFVAFWPPFCRDIIRNVRPFTFFTRTLQLSDLNHFVNCAETADNFFTVGIYVFDSYRICEKNMGPGPVWESWAVLKT